MDSQRVQNLSSRAKLVRVVLDNCGPLSPREVASEAYIDREAASEALSELTENDLATPVCGVCDAKEVVYELVETPAE